MKLVFKPILYEIHGTLYYEKKNDVQSQTDYP